MDFLSQSDQFDGGKLWTKKIVIVAPKQKHVLDTHLTMFKVREEETIKILKPNIKILKKIKKINCQT